MTVFVMTMAALAAPTNFVTTDVDLDGVDDLVIGVDDPCGAIHVWLSSDGPWQERTSGEALRAPSMVLVPRECDPDFGRSLFLERDLLWTWSDEKSGYEMDLLALAQQSESTHAFEKIELAVDKFPAPTGARCDPCCGPSNCCITNHCGG